MCVPPLRVLLSVDRRAAGREYVVVVDDVEVTSLSIRRPQVDLVLAAGSHSVQVQSIDGAALAEVCAEIGTSGPTFACFIVSLPPATWRRASDAMSIRGILLNTEASAPPAFRTRRLWLVLSTVAIAIAAAILLAWGQKIAVEWRTAGVVCLGFAFALKVEDFVWMARARLGRGRPTREITLTG